MATAIAWPAGLDATLFGLRLVRPGARQIRSDDTAHTLLVDRGGTIFGGQYRVRPYDYVRDHDLADLVDYLAERLTGDDVYVDMKIPRTSFVTDGATRGGSAIPITVKSVGTETLTLTQKDAAAAVDAVNGNLAASAKQGALIRVNNRLTRVENPTVSSTGEVSFRLFPNILNLIEVGDTIHPPDQIRVRLDTSQIETQLETSSGGVIRGPWILDFREFVADPLDDVVARGVERLLEIQPIVGTVGQILPLRLVPYAKSLSGGALSYEIEQVGDIVAPTLAGRTLNHRLVKAGTSIMTVVFRESVNGLKDEQSYLVVANEPANNTPPGVRRNIPPISGQVGGRDEIDPLGHIADQDLDRLEFAGSSSNPAVATVRYVGGKLRIAYLMEGECTGYLIGTDPSGRTVTIEFEILVAGILPGLPDGRGVDTGGENTGPYYGDSGVEGFVRATFEGSYPGSTSTGGNTFVLTFSDLDDYFGDFKGEPGTYTVADLTTGGALTDPVIDGKSLDVEVLSRTGTARIRVTRTNENRNKAASGEFEVAITESQNPPTVGLGPVIPLTPSGTGRNRLWRWTDVANGMGSGIRAVIKTNPESSKVRATVTNENRVADVSGDYIYFERLTGATARDPSITITFTVTQVALGQLSADGTVRVVMPSRADRDASISFDQPEPVLLKAYESRGFDRTDLVTPNTGVGLWAEVADKSVALSTGTGYGLANLNYQSQGDSRSVRQTSSRETVFSLNGSPGFAERTVQIIVGRSDRNRKPVWVGPSRRLLAMVVGQTYSGLDLRNFGTDPDGDPLVYGVSNTHDTVATFSLAADGYTLNRAPVAAGGTNLTLQMRATQGNRETVRKTVNVRVDASAPDPSTTGPGLSFSAFPATGFPASGEPALRKGSLFYINLANYYSAGESGRLPDWSRVEVDIPGTGSNFVQAITPFVGPVVGFRVVRDAPVGGVSVTVGFAVHETTSGLRSPTTGYNNTTVALSEPVSLPQVSFRETFPTTLKATVGTEGTLDVAPFVVYAGDRSLLRYTVLTRLRNNNIVGDFASFASDRESGDPASNVLTYNKGSYGRDSYYMVIGVYVDGDFNAVVPRAILVTTSSGSGGGGNGEGNPDPNDEDGD